MGFFLGIFLYVGLSFRTPLQWTQPVWFLLAFLVVPALVGLVNGLKKYKPRSAGQGFRMSFYAGAWAMFLYAGINMMIAHSRVGSGGNAAASLLAGLLVAIIYALIAGVVAGAVCAAIVKRCAGGQHEPAL